MSRQYKNYPNLPSVTDMEADVLLGEGDIFEGTVPENQRRSQWGVVAPPPMRNDFIQQVTNEWLLPTLPQTNLGRGNYSEGPLTQGPAPIINYKPGAKFIDDEGTIYNDPNIFPPKYQGDLPHQFAPMPVGLYEKDQTPLDIQREALEAFAPDRKTLKAQSPPFAPPPFAPISPPYSSGYPSPMYPPSPNYASQDAHKGVVEVIGDWFNNMGKGGKTKKTRKKGKRKTIIKLKKSKKSRRR
jgi:hypothetical protein